MERVGNSINLHACMGVWVESISHGKFAHLRALPIQIDVEKAAKNWPFSFGH